MRYLTLTLLLAAGLYSQIPPSPVPNLFGAKPPAVVEQPKPEAGPPTLDWRRSPWTPGQQVPSKLSKGWSLVPSLKRPAAPAPALHLLPDLKTPALPKFVPPHPPVKVVARRPRECAIPLINVPPPEPGAVIGFATIPQGVFPMKEAVPPAPPCDARK